MDKSLLIFLVGAGAFLLWYRLKARPSTRPSEDDQWSDLARGVERWRPEPEDFYEARSQRMLYPSYLSREYHEAPSHVYTAPSQAAPSQAAPSQAAPSQSAPSQAAPRQGINRISSSLRQTAPLPAGSSSLPKAAPLPAGAVSRSQTSSLPQQVVSLLR